MHMGARMQAGPTWRGAIGQRAETTGPADQGAGLKVSAGASHAPQANHAVSVCSFLVASTQHNNHSSFLR
jgi:hypothetical protein